jgi:hypothetical protein
MKLLKAAWSGWMKIARVIGNFQAQVLFTVFYFIILFPVGLGIRFFSDPLNLKTKKMTSNFVNWEHPQEDTSAARKPY